MAAGREEAFKRRVQLDFVCEILGAVDFGNPYGVQFGYFGDVLGVAASRDFFVNIYGCSWRFSGVFS